MRKKVVFITSVWEWWPKTLYRDLVNLLNEKYPEYEYSLVSSAKEWIKLHFLNNKYDLIISSIPFFWKPPKCDYIIQQHWLYKNDRWFTSIPKLLAWFYPYNTFFSKIVLYPSEFLKKYYNSKHRNQKVILNFSSFPIIKNEIKSLENKNEINLLTIFRADIYNKARWILDLYEKLKLFKPNKKINYKVAWFWKYYEEMKKSFDSSKLDKNINIKWIGWLDKDWVIEEVNKCDIFLYSTFYETFWIILLEVLSLWKPILLNNYESYYWLYDEEFISKDNKEFINKLSKLINNDEYYNQYFSKVSKNLERFDKNTIINEWYQLIKEQI